MKDKEVLDFIKRVSAHYGKKHPSVGSDEFYAIGEEIMVRYVREYDAKQCKSFLNFISKYIVCEMLQHIRQFVYGIHQENNETTCTNVLSIEEMNLNGRKEGDDYYTAEERLGMLVNDMDEEKKRIWDILEPLLDTLSDDERKLIMTRYGICDNDGETIDEYLEEHEMESCTFYRKAQAILLKLQMAARGENN